MRRILAILLLAAFGLPVAAPAFAMTGTADAHLPACCRRDGAHRCAMSLDKPLLGKPAGSPTFRSICPNFPRPAAVAPAGTLAAAGLSPAHHALFASATGQVQRAEAQRRISCGRSHHKRGPPAVLPS
jgi:hypothetical protein